MTLALVTGNNLTMGALIRGMSRHGRATCALPEIGELRDIPLNGRDCVLLITGTGPIHVARAIRQLLDTRPWLEGIVCAGLAGSFGSMAPAGTVARTGRALCTPGIFCPETRELLGYTEEKPVPIDLDGSPEQFHLGPLPAGCLLATTLTMPESVFDAETEDRTRRLLMGPNEAQMLSESILLESTGNYPLAYLCKQRDVPVLDVRVVCCPAGRRVAQQAMFEQEFASLGAIVRNLFAGTHESM